MRRIVFTFACVAAALAACVPAVAADPLMFVYKGAGCDGKGRLPRYEGVIGRKQYGVTDFFSAESWQQMQSGAQWALGCWQGSGYRLAVGLPLIVKGGSLGAAAAGEYDDEFRKIGALLVAKGQANAIVRLGWEFNGTWMGWSICQEDGSGLSSAASDFVPAFQNIVTSMRSVSGANFKFIWNPIDSSNASCPGASLEDFYPGDSYVDVVALDAYDAIGATTTDQDRWTDLLNGVNAGGWTAVAPAAINGQAFPGYGLSWLAAFGQEHGKQIGLPEWGLVDTGTDGGGGDDAYYMTQMADWIKANASGPVIFWNYGGGTLTLDIPNYTNGDTPNATAAFQSAFSAGI